jgi:hypothetical protein
MPTIINHKGLTSLLPEPKEASGRTYPFVYFATEPEEKSWTYRLLSYGPEAMTDKDLAELLQRVRRMLRADWEEQVAHPVGFLTLYPPSPDGGSDERRVRYERGPDLEPDLGRPGEEPKTPAPDEISDETPDDKSDDIDFSF